MRFSGVNNEITQPVYDTVQSGLAAGQVMSFFTTPLNGVMAGAVLKTYNDTNMIQAGRLEKGIEHTITGITLSLREFANGGAAITLADYDQFYNHAHVNLLIGQVSFLRLAACHIPAGVEEWQYYSNIAAAATEYRSNHGLGSAANRYDLGANTLILEDQESIEVQVTVDAALVAVIDVKVTLHGHQTRPVR